MKHIATLVIALSFVAFYFMLPSEGIKPKTTLRLPSSSSRQH